MWAFLIIFVAVMGIVTCNKDKVVEQTKQMEIQYKIDSLKSIKEVKPDTYTIQPRLMIDTSKKENK